MSKWALLATLVAVVGLVGRVDAKAFSVSVARVTLNTSTGGRLPMRGVV